VPPSRASGGVVTFDWDCFQHHMNSLDDSFGLEEIQLRLYIQVLFILQFIGGADGLNLAGGTTAVETADCDDCACSCESATYNWITQGEFTGTTYFKGSFVEGEGVVQECLGGFGSDSTFNIAFLLSLVPGRITRILLDLNVIGASTTYEVMGLVTPDAEAPTGQILLASGTTSGTTDDLSLDPDTYFYGFQIVTTTDDGCGSADAKLQEITWYSPDLCDQGLC